MRPSLKWDRRFLRLAEHVASWSKDPSTKVGAILVNEDRIVLGQGYNGFPRGCSDDPVLYLDRDIKYSRIVHAEINALLNAGSLARGCDLYVWCPGYGNPCICAECAKAAINAGINRIVGVQEDETAIAQRYASSRQMAQRMLDEAGIPWEGIVL